MAELRVTLSADARDEVTNGRLIRRRESFTINPTTVEAWAGDTIVWEVVAPHGGSNLSFAVHFIQRTPMEKDIDIPPGVADPERWKGKPVSVVTVKNDPRQPTGSARVRSDVDGRVYEYAAAVCIDGEVFIHLSGEVKKRP